MTETRICACGQHVWFDLAAGLVGLASSEDRAVIEQWPWKAERKGALTYVSRSIQTAAGPRKAYLHRALLDASAPQIDHVNHNGLDNRRSNLRGATHSQNQANSRVKPGASGVRGVRQKPGRDRWEAGISIGGVPRHLGSFLTKAEAEAAVTAARQSAFGPFAGAP